MKYIIAGFIFMVLVLIWFCRGLGVCKEKGVDLSGYTEKWIETNLFCPYCLGSPVFRKEKGPGYYCGDCEKQFEYLKDNIYKEKDIISDKVKS